MKTCRANRQRGQLTVFFATTIVVLITITAFVINVGMYVKAKINLQNAVDAAAWSGAAVQARYLTNIAYLNYEMRKVYKEWMFKYYVIGHVSLSQVEKVIGGDTSAWAGKEFRLNPWPGTSDSDKWNLPSTCFHFTSGTPTADLCDVYSVPGLPRFPNMGLGGVDDVFNAAFDTMAEEKAKDCSRRSQVNMKAATHWAFGVTGTPDPAYPVIAMDRPGAWPKAIELAVRIRNLERFVNKAPEASLTLAQVGALKGQDNPGNERPIKAFMSAFRNLGGVSDTDASGRPIEMKGSFKLREIAPTAMPAPDKNSLSGILINVSYPKYYLDLKIQMLNLVTFVTAFVTNTESDSGPVQGQAACGATKIGLPIPNYPMGFEKNAKMLTYYAVEGETNFNGLFNPFERGATGTLIRAYAAAKPFGGRVGPKFFDTRDSLSIHARPDLKSFHYVTGLDTSMLSGAYNIGDPIPTDSNFWVRMSSDVIGGSPGGSGLSAKFSLPNMIYDFASTLSKGLGDVAIVKDTGFADPTSLPGLYDGEQLKKFASNLGSVSGGLTGDQIDLGIKSALAPTAYEAANYLVPLPSFSDLGLNLDAVPPVQGSTLVHSSRPNLRQGRLKVFAPLFCDQCEFTTMNAISDYIQTTFLANSVTPMQAFLKAMREVAASIKAKGDAVTVGDKSIYDKASKWIATYKPEMPALSGGGGFALDCNSIAGRIIDYYMGPDHSTSVEGDFNTAFTTPATDNLCEPKKMIQEVKERWSTYGLNPNEPYVQFYDEEYFFKQPTDASQAAMYFSAYMPGKNQGALDDSGGIVPHPFGGSSSGPTRFRIFSKRNYYSTKFVALSDLQSQKGYFHSNTTTFAENSGAGVSVANEVPPSNMIDAAADAELGNIRH